MPGSQDHATHTRAVGDGVTPRQGPGRAPNLPSQQAGGVREATSPGHCGSCRVRPNPTAVLGATPAHRPLNDGPGRKPLPPSGEGLLCTLPLRPPADAGEACSCVCVWRAEECGAAATALVSPHTCSTVPPFWVLGSRFPKEEPSHLSWDPDQWGFVQTQAGAALPPARPGGCRFGRSGGRG